MKKILLFASALLISGGLMAQSRPAAKPAPKAPATATKPKAPENTATTTDETSGPAPELDENGWPIAKPGEETTTAAPAKGNSKAPAAKGKTTSGKPAAPAKPVVYQEAKFSYLLDAEPLPAGKGIPSKGKGVLGINVPNHQKVEKENPKLPVKMQIKLVEYGGKTEHPVKELVLPVAKKGIDLSSYFDTPLEPGDKIEVSLTNVKTPQTSVIEVDIPESTLFAFTLDGKKLDKKKGLATASAGTLVISAKNASKVGKLDEAEAQEVKITHLRGNDVVNTISSTLAEAETGLQLSGIVVEPKTGDRVKIELTNAEDPQVAYLPVN